MRLQETIELVRKGSKTHSRIVGILRGLVLEDDETYVNIDSLTSAFHLGPVFSKYNPDVHAFTKRDEDKIDVFQVWHRESIEAAVFDLLRSTMIPQIRRLHIIIAQNEDFPLWKEKDVFWKLTKELLGVLQEPFRSRLEEELVSGCVCVLSQEDLEKDDACVKNKLAKSLGFR